MGKGTIVYSVVSCPQSPRPLTLLIPFHQMLGFVEGGKQMISLLYAAHCPKAAVFVTERSEVLNRNARQKRSLYRNGWGQVVLCILASQAEVLVL